MTDLPRIPIPNLSHLKRATYVERTTMSGEVVYAPESWSDNAVNVVASRYFRGNPGDPDRETSVFDLISRVAETSA